MAALAACAPSTQPDASGAAPSVAPRVSTSTGTEVPAENVTASSEALPSTDSAASYEQAQLTCVILSNVGGDQDETQALLESEVALPADEARVFLRLATEFVCPDVGKS